MQTQTPLYLTGTSHWLTEQQAKSLAGTNDKTKREADGTWSVIHLDAAPRYAGQSAFRA